MWRCPYTDSTSLSIPLAPDVPSRAGEKQTGKSTSGTHSQFRRAEVLEDSVTISATSIDRQATCNTYFWTRVAARRFVRAIQGDNIIMVILLLFV
jgi:hypothetical protein